MAQQRVVFLDYLRVIACFMVILVHACEFFYIGDGGIVIASDYDAFWTAVMNSPCRCAVPLFVMISSWLLVPLREPTSKFFSRRLTRVVIPFLIWSVLYATLPYIWGAMSADDVLSSLLHLVANFNMACGHLWFVYMLIGLYLFMPVISPWLRQAGKREHEWFLVLWAFSTCFPYIRYAAGGEVYGESYWNAFHTFYYFAGYAGYMVLANYIKLYVKWSTTRSLVVGALFYLAGYYITARVWYAMVPVASTFAELELSWSFCTINVAMMSFGVFMIVKGLAGASLSEPKWIVQASNLSYGVYLMHIFILGVMYSLISPYLSTPFTMITVALSTFVCCFVIARIIKFIPGGKWLIG